MITGRAAPGQGQQQRAPSAQGKAAKKAGCLCRSRCRSNVAFELHSLVNQQQKQAESLTAQLVAQRLKSTAQSSEAQMQLLLPAVAAQAAAMTASMLTGQGSSPATAKDAASVLSSFATPYTPVPSGPRLAAPHQAVPDSAQLARLQQQVLNWPRAAPGSAYESAGRAQEPRGLFGEAVTPAHGLAPVSPLAESIAAHSSADAYAVVSKQGSKPQVRLQPFAHPDAQ